MDAILRLHRIWLSSPSEGRQAELGGAPLNGESFTGTDLRCLHAAAASFHESRFYDVDLGGSDVTGAEFNDARMHHSRLTELAAEQADFAGARIDHCDFSRAKLVGARFARAHLVACSFRDADLQECDFREVRMRGSDFRGANLRGAIGLTAEHLAQAIIDDATVLP
jgi:uncharacterized protein YjbI with pentapeptide repeats